MTKTSPRSFAPARRRSGFLAKTAPLAALAGALAVGGCSQSPISQHAKEYFSPAVYGQASPRVVAEGERAPKGGGHYLVGHAYTVAGRTYVPSTRKYSKVGLASWYGDAFHGRRTANGEIYDPDAITAANPTMPLPSYARVTNLRNHRSLIVRVNDRGPFHANRIMDLSERAAELLKFKKVGTALVKVQYIGRASLSGSDDRKLMATLRINGRPARLDGHSLSPVRVADQLNITQPPHYDRQTEQIAMAQPESLPPEAQAGATQRFAMADQVGPSGDLPQNPPLPPRRPFDLGTIPGADALVAVARR